jgi:phosphatidyl-myo-inositol alpha-mannosyltransferase
MKILVYPHTMEIGGSPINAVDLAGAVHKRGHEVIVLSEPGPMVERVRGMGLEHLQIRQHRRRPSLKAIGMLARLVRERRLDVVHGYESMPVIEAFFGPGRYRTPVLGTVMSMSVKSYVPRTVPLIVGTEQIREIAVASGYRRVTVLEPPVDIEADNPSVEGRNFRAEHDIGPDEVLVVMICRLVPELKLEGLRAACDAVGELASTGCPVRLVIVGDGLSRKEVADHAEKANAAAGRQVVLLTGEIDDPRPAYAAADVTVGQGSSALRGMAFGKPLVVVGEDGFSELLTPGSAPIFLRQGWYGLGPGSLGIGAPALRLALEQLVGSPGLRRELGAFARQLVVDRFSLRRAAQLLEAEYLAAIGERVAVGPLIVDLVRSASGVLGSKLQRQYRRWRGTAAIDNPKGIDSPNARPEMARFLARGVALAQSRNSPPATGSLLPGRSQTGSTEEGQK